MIVKLFLKSLILFTLMIAWINDAGIFAAENLIRNGGMEQGEGNPANWGMWGWQMQNAIFRLETGDAHSGNRFATIINNENNDARFIQEVLVEEGKIYRITGWIKTENVGEGAGVKGASICLLEDEFHSSRDIKGTNGKWEPVEFYVEIGRYMIKITISLGVGGSRKLNTGKASFDDVEIMEVKIVPQGALFTKVEGKPENLPPTPPEESASKEEKVVTSHQPAVKKSWISNPLFFIVIILVIVLIAAVVILVFAPKTEKSGYVDEGSGETATEGAEKSTGKPGDGRE